MGDTTKKDLGSTCRNRVSSLPCLPSGSIFLEKSELAHATVCLRQKNSSPNSLKKSTRGTKLNELDKKRTGTSQMSKRFGPNFAPGSFALQQCIQLVYTLRALSRDRYRATRATRDNQDAHTQKEHTHARQRRHSTTASPRLRRGAGRCCCRGAATAAAAAAVLLLSCCCFTTRDASRSTNRHNRLLFLVLRF